MHYRSVSGSATEPNIQPALLQKRGSLQGAIAGSHTYSAGARAPSRLSDAQYARAASASASAPVSLSRAGKSFSDDDSIVCQSNLYDAYELQGFEHHLDRNTLDVDNDRTTRPISSVISGPEPHRSLLSASNLISDHPSRTNYLQDMRSRCPCNLCNSANAENSSSVSSAVITDSSLPMRSILTEPAAAQPKAEATCSSTARAADRQEEISTGRSLSMPRWYYHGGAAGRPPHELAAQEEDLQVREDPYPLSSTVKTHKRSPRCLWPFVNSFVRYSLKKLNNILITEEDETSPPTAMNVTNGSRQQWNKELHHHHSVVHYHHVYHHHHHHVVNGVHFEEIDWPLSPARLQELGWLMSKSRSKSEDF